MTRGGLSLRGQMAQDGAPEVVGGVGMETSRRDAAAGIEPRAGQSEGGGGSETMRGGVKARSYSRGSTWVAIVREGGASAAPAVR